MRCLFVVLATLLAIALAACGSSSGHAPSRALGVRAPHPSGAPTPSTSPRVHFVRSVRPRHKAPGKYGSAASPYPGEVFTTTTGGWNNCGAAGASCTYAYAWKHSSGGAYTTASGSPTNTSSYTTVSGDSTDTLQVTVTATNTVGSASQTSAATGAVSTIIKSFSMETGAANRFDSSNGTLSYSTAQHFGGSFSALTPMVTQTIDRGWMWQSTTGDYCEGSAPDAAGFVGGNLTANTLAPIGSTRDITGEFYVTNTTVTGERLVALSYDPSCVTSDNHSSIVELDLTNGLVNALAGSYGVDPGGVTLGTTATLPFPANQWNTVDLKVKVTRDGTGLMQLTVNGVSTPVVNGATMQTTYGNYNEVQWGSGWCEASCSGNVYTDDAQLANP